MQYFVGNDNHTLADYEFRCRICVIKVEIEESFQITSEDKAHFYAITGIKLRSNRNFSTVICSPCKRDLCFSFYFKVNAKKIQTYLNQKGEDCINGSDSEEEAVVLEGYPTFVLNECEENELPEIFNNHTELPKSFTDNNKIQKNKFFEQCNGDFKKDATTRATTINKGCDKRKPATSKAYKYKPSIINNNQKYETENVSNKLLKTPKEKSILQCNTKNETTINHIQSPKKVLKKGFPSILSRRKSVRNINKELEKQAIIVPQETIKRKKKKNVLMLTRSKTLPKGPKENSGSPKETVKSGMFVCPAPCYKIFSSNSNLYRHQRESHQEIKKQPMIKEEPNDNKCPVKPYKCQICMKFYETAASLRHHVAAHLDLCNNVINICEYCGFMDEEKAIKRHKLAKHTNPKFQCPICKQTFRLLKTVERHIQSTHYLSETPINNTFGGIRNRGRKNSIF